MITTKGNFLQYYEKQRGGEIPVFRGGQQGDGLGDILRGILRFIAPIALRGVSKFAGSTLKAREQGASWKDAAKGAIAPTLGAIAKDVLGNVSSQGGSGAMFHGVEGVPVEAGRLYKKRKPSKKHSVKKVKKHKSSKFSAGGVLNY
jgi:hypothetical protein